MRLSQKSKHAPTRRVDLDRFSVYRFRGRLLFIMELPHLWMPLDKTRHSVRTDCIPKSGEKSCKNGDTKITQPLMMTDGQRFSAARRKPM